MDNPRTFTAKDLAVSAVLLGPVIVIFSMPLMIGIGVDIFDALGEVPFALALSAPLALLPLRRFSPPPVERQPAPLARPRLPLVPAGGLSYASRSIR